jgi:hypothetical protein
MKANRISKVDTSLVGQSPTRAYGAPQMAGIDFDGATNTLNIFPDSPNTENARKIAIGGFKNFGLAPDLTTTLDFALGAFQSFATATGTNVLTFSNGVAGATYTVKVVNTAGTDTITWPASVEWPGGTPPTLSATGEQDIFQFYFDGTTYFGSTFGLAYTV